MTEMMAKVFKGTNVYMSRNLVPPELFDTLHDALKLNGAQVYLCCDPSRNASTDYHIISSPEHEKFEDLRLKGCNLIGPQCVLSCAKEHRPLPKQGFTCCLAMDGVKLLASGFEMEQKVEMVKMVNAMGGVLQSKAAMDVSFVVVKNVLAAKYKVVHHYHPFHWLSSGIDLSALEGWSTMWAMNILKKPVVTISWLQQCWNEHRVVPHESFRVLPFSGLTICVSRIPADERKQMEKLIIQNGGKYSAELTKKCTHLISDAPEGDKYKVAVRWGHIHVVTRRWYEQSVARRACLNEESYPVQGSSASLNTVRKVTGQSQDKGLGSSQNVVSSAGVSSDPQAWYAQSRAPDIQATISRSTSTFSDAPVVMKDEDCGPLASQPKCFSDFDGCVADDSQSEDNDLYLSDCKILLAGFAAPHMRKLVNMVRMGGGSRYMSFSENLTHIIVGAPSDAETRQIRNLAALGVIFVVTTHWLEDCSREKREVPVLRRHIAYDLLLPKDPVCSHKRSAMCSDETKQGRSSDPSMLSVDNEVKMNTAKNMTVEKKKEVEGIAIQEISREKTGKSAEEGVHCTSDGNCNIKTQKGTSVANNPKSSSVFEGKTFCFSASFPENQRGEIIEWVNQGGGEVVEKLVGANVHFIVEGHGVVIPKTDPNLRKYVSSHWIRSCLMDGCLLDVGSHILYSPLPCQVPFAAFENMRFCVSQYDEKERLLLKNLCFILKVKFVENLTKKVTHLLCKFASGPKYKASCRWGMKIVTAEWVYECVKQNKIVSSDTFYPKEVTSMDRDMGSCILTQHPTQAIRMISMNDDVSQFPSQSQDLKDTGAKNFLRNDAGDKNFLRNDAGDKNFLRNDAATGNTGSSCNKKERIMEANQVCFLSSGSIPNNGTSRMNSPTSNNPESTKDIASALPDVAAAIEDLLEQTSKIQEQKSPDRSRDSALFTSDCNILGQDHGEPQSALALPNHWISRFSKNDETHAASVDLKCAYDSFSETQTESQVVGYAEDLSGRQMIIDRVRTRSSMS